MEISEFHELDWLWTNRVSSLLGNRKFLSYLFMESFIRENVYLIDIRILVTSKFCLPNSFDFKFVSLFKRNGIVNFM